MLSPSGKVEWLCSECRSGNIIERTNIGFYDYTTPDIHNFECKDCGYFANWRTRIKKSNQEK